MSEHADVAVVGAGVGALAAALRLAGAGAKVVVLESQDQPGGKMRELPAGPQRIDAGPTVLTMRPVFEQLWAGAGLDFHAHVPTVALEVLARHRWSDASELDLYADLERSMAAIATFAGPREADAFAAFHRKVNEIVKTVQAPFMYAPDNRVWTGLSRAGWAGLWQMSRIEWHRSLWRMLGSYFKDARLRQLFARYATYYGSDPFQAPGTLALIAGVEMAGVWRVQGGMHQLAKATQRAATNLGAHFVYGAHVSSIETDSQGVCALRCEDGRRWRCRNVVFNGSLDHLHKVVCPQLGPGPGLAPSLSAVTLTGLARCEGMDLAWHNVLFSADYRLEFEEIFKGGHMPRAPTTYICAQDRDDATSHAPGTERIFALLNAPAHGGPDAPEISKEAALAAMKRVTRPCAINIDFDPATLIVTTPRQFAQRFPGTQGALYGPATHGVRGAFARKNAQTRIPGLFVVGGEVHPGAGIPMVTLGGSHCADLVLTRLGLTRPSVMAATPGGISTPSVTMSNTP